VAVGTDPVSKLDWDEDEWAAAQQNSARHNDVTLDNIYNRFDATAEQPTNDIVYSTFVVELE